MDRLREAAKIAAIACAPALAWPAPASAVVVTAGTTVASCRTTDGATVSNCAVTAFYSTAPATETTSFISGDIHGVSPLTADFRTAFNAWNAANGNAWTLVDGGLLNLTLTTALTPAATGSGGGISPVLVTIGNGVPGTRDPGLGQFAWTQALFTDYTPAAGLGRTPTITLDTYSLSHGSSGGGTAFTNPCTPIPGPPNATNNTAPSTVGPTPPGTAFCDPIYPFQYGTVDNGGVIGGTTLTTDFFYDAPQGPWLAGSFRAIALISTVTDDTDSQGAITDRVLTVYQGVDYGFDLGTAATVNTARTVTDLAPAAPTPVPEPRTAGTLALGLLATLLLRRRPAQRPGR